MKIFNKEDKTFSNIQDRALAQWLDEMENHPDVSVRGGVRLARDYVQYLKNEIEELKAENEVKKNYLLKVAKEKRK